VLLIRDSQMALLEADARRRFERAMRAEFFLQAGEAAVPWSPEDWDALVPSMMQRTQAYGLDDCASARRFMGYVARFGVDFERQPGHEWMADILEDPDLGASEKIAWIDDGLARAPGA